jgi:hypothetical protein
MTVQIKTIMSVRKVLSYIITFFYSSSYGNIKTVVILYLILLIEKMVIKR